VNITIKTTADGSPTLFREDLNEPYHSLHGAVTESRHVFIGYGWDEIRNRFSDGGIRLLEVGFGTGLNAILTAAAAQASARPVNYTALEPIPIPEELGKTLLFTKSLRPEEAHWQQPIHGCEWEKCVDLSPFFTLTKTTRGIQHFTAESPFHLIYFDAFAPEKQPDMWSTEVMKNCFDMLVPGGLLVTYCAKGSFKRSLKAVGFLVESRPGPPFKREMTFAIKPLG
jgi:tRNA U34 5-methylaminomethyl-2-thiouridine-forming methyltransferase MnmC